MRFAKTWADNKHGATIMYVAISKPFQPII
jgi:hypothetical protein